MTSADRFRHKKVSAVNGPWAASTLGWFAVAYGPFRRLYGSSPDAQCLMVIPGRIPRFATLFKEDATLQECEEWAKQLMYKKLENRETERKTLESLLTLLRDDFLRQGITIEDVDSDGIWLRDNLGRRMSLSDMSEGYRSALAMLIDIFRHMVDVYGPDDLFGRTRVGPASSRAPASYLSTRLTHTFIPRGNAKSDSGSNSISRRFNSSSRRTVPLFARLPTVGGSIISHNRHGRTVPAHP